MNHNILKVVALALVLSACKSTPMHPPAKVEDTNVSRPAKSQSNSNSGSSANTATIKTVEVESSQSQWDAGGEANRHIYFDYDSDSIRSEFKELIVNHASHLKSNPSAKVVLQGNSDERGSREYNLALGQRRSVAVKNALNVLGVNNNQIETVSFGEEHATPNCGDEECFQNDRRVDVEYPNQ